MGILANSVKIGVLLSAAGPVAAQSAREQPRVVTMPDGRTVYVVPAQRGDTRTKQPPVRTVVAPDGRTIYVVEEQPKRSEEHTSELQSLMRISYAVFCLKQKKQ